MKQILFRKEAESDLRDIIVFYEDVAPQAVDNILNDIYRSVDQLAHFPHLGMQVEHRKYRRIVTLKYHFKIAYQADGNSVIILGIFRYQDREV